jgi:tRNA A-37 threonylcarbamoyl transferase component Bud32
MDIVDTRDTADSASPGGAAPVGRDAVWLGQVLGEWHWRVHPAWRFLLDAGAPEWKRLEHDPRACLVKSNDSRQVWRVQVGDQLVFAKVASPPKHWARLRRMALGSDAAHEARIAEYAVANGINAVRPVAWAEARIPGGRPACILITAGLPAALPLDDFWKGLDPHATETRAIKNEVIDVAARLLAHAHQCGFEHYDLHAGNVLLDIGPDGRRPLFVDLHNVRIGRPVTDRTVVSNLAQFNQWFRLRTPVSDRVRFLDQYLHYRETFKSASPLAVRLGLGRRELLAQLDAAAAEHARSLYSTRDRRVLRSGRYFAQLRLAGGWSAHVFLESKHPVGGSPASELTFTKAQWRGWLERPLDWVSLKDRSRLIKDSASAIVCRGELPHPSGALPVICKRSTPKNLLKRMVSLVRPSRPMLTWKRGNALLHRQIPTARPLAVLERRRGGLLLDSVLITEQVAPAFDLDSLLTVQMRELSDERQRTLKLQVGRALVHVVRMMHERGVTHRDFKAPNIIVQWDAARETPPGIVLVDLDGVRVGRDAARQRRIQMLVRLNVSLDHCRRVTRADRLRFLKGYLRRLGGPADDWKSLWRHIEGLSHTKRTTRERSQQKKFAKYGRF